MRLLRAMQHPLSRRLQFSLQARDGHSWSRYVLVLLGRLEHFLPAAEDNRHNGDPVQKLRLARAWLYRCGIRSVATIARLCSEKIAIGNYVKSVDYCDYGFAGNDFVSCKKMPPQSVTAGQVRPPPLVHHDQLCGDEQSEPRPP